MCLAQGNRLLKSWVSCEHWWVICCWDTGWKGWILAPSVRLNPCVILSRSVSQGSCVFTCKVRL